ncbi:uncharacterized protein LOC142556945 [Primulina tabacum]|uniref:uncharacterized protein LOC142556945 n=1 Tax=Primulina tabacum TaxID=48773 RepID=UPI003F5966A3
MNIPCHVDKVINAQSSEEKQKNRLRLAATIESIRWLILKACTFREHDESPSSNNHGNFIEMINFIGKMNKSIGDIILEKAPKNAKYTSPDIQKDVLNIISNQVRAKIRKEIGDEKFWILVDEARDASNKEQMAIVLIFVDSEGFLRERSFAIVYDGASNMRGSWNGLKALFLKDCSCAYYVQCFAHRLQLALTEAAEKEVSIWLFFSKLNSICNLINASPKRHGELHSAQRIEVAHMVATGECDTDNGNNKSSLSSIAREISRILSVMDYVSTTKTLLRTLREEGFDLLLSHVKEVCVKYDIEIPHMEARYKSGTGRSC